MHSRWSDGTYTTAELFARVRAARLRAFALTDHDSISGIDEIAALAREDGIELVSGIELSTNHKGCDFHVLGYFIDHRSPVLLQGLRHLREERRGRAEKIVNRLRELGCALTMEDVRAVHHGGSVGRPHIAMAMVKNGLVADQEEAFQRYLRVGAPGYVAKYQFPTLEGIELVRAAGGVPVLAHPGTASQPSLVPDLLADRGLKGVEVFHPKHSPSVETMYRQMAAEHRLIPTGGSDCHGGKPGDTPVGCRTVGYEVVEALRSGRT